MRLERINPIIQIDRDLCTTCWKCVRSCPAEILLRNPPKNEEGKRAVKIIKPELCFECRACEIVCPVSAIKIMAGMIETAIPK